MTKESKNQKHNDVYNKQNPLPLIHLRYVIICSSSSTLVNVQSHLCPPQSCTELITFSTMETTIYVKNIVLRNCYFFNLNLHITYYYAVKTCFNRLTVFPLLQNFLYQQEIFRLLHHVLCSPSISVCHLCVFECDKAVKLWGGGFHQKTHRFTCLPLNQQHYLPEWHGLALHLALIFSSVSMIVRWTAALTQSYTMKAFHISPCRASSSPRSSGLWPGNPY